MKQLWESCRTSCSTSYMELPSTFMIYFLRTLVTIAQSPFDLKPYAPWIMRIIRPPVFNQLQGWSSEPPKLYAWHWNSSKHTIHGSWQRQACYRWWNSSPWWTMSSTYLQLPSSWFYQPRHYGKNLKAIFITRRATCHDWPWVAYKSSWETWQASSMG